MKKIYVLFLVAFVLSCLIIGCVDEPIDPVYDPNDKGGPTPNITGITPEGAAYASYNDIVLRGQNFSPVDTHNFVYFNTTKVPVKSASPTELTVVAPNIVGDEINIKVAVMGAQLFSNSIKYKILPTFIELSGGYTAADAFYAIETDVNGNLYVNIETGTTGRVDKISPDGNVTQYATLGFGLSYGMRFGPDGTLWFTRRSTIISKVPPGVDRSSNLSSSLVSGYTFYDLDFDKNGNMWVVGYHSTAAQRRIIKMKDSTVTGNYTFNARFRAVKVFNDYLYVAGLDGADGDKTKIWRAPINGSADLGNFELYYDWSAKYTSAINSLTIAADGTIYVGTDGPNSETIIAISPNKVASSLYPNDMSRSTFNVSWGSNSQYIYVSRRAAASGGSALNKILKIYMGKEGAPYYGRK